MTSSADSRGLSAEASFSPSDPYCDPATSDAGEQQQMVRYLHDAPHGSWDSSAYLSPMLTDDSLISPFASAFEQAASMGQSFPSANMQDGEFQQNFRGNQAQHQIPQWYGLYEDHHPQQTLLSLDNMSWNPPSPPFQDGAASSSSPNSNMLGYRSTGNIQSGNTRTLRQSQGNPPYKESRSGTMDKDRKKRGRTGTDRRDSAGKASSNAVEAKSRGRRVSVATPIKDEPSLTPLSSTPTRLNDSSSAVPRQSTQLSDESNHPSHVAPSSPVASSSSTRQDNDFPDADNDHDIKRARNRAAATKCRAKNKRAMNALEESSRIITEQRELLSITAASLKNEVLALKTELLRHGDCDCVLIQTYINKMARNVGEGRT